jgi:integrase
MRREVGSMEEVSPGLWRLRVSIGNSTVTGKRRRPSVTVRGDEGKAAIAFAKLLLEAGRLPEEDVSVRQFLVDMYLPHVEGRLRARTVDGYRSKIENHILDELGDTCLSDLTPYVLDRWLDGVTGSERNRLHVYRVLNAALNVAMRWRLLENNPLRAVEVPKVHNARKPEVLSLEEAAKYLKAFEGHALEPLVVLALAAGLRRSELAGLRWSDLRFWKETGEDGTVTEYGEVSVARGLHDRKGEVIEEPPKSATSMRIVALPAWAVAVLRPLRGLGPLVVEDGAPMKPWRISQAYERRVSEAKLRRVQFKNLRHSHACLLLDAGVDLYTVSRRLGHSTVAVTESHYVKPSERADRAAAEALKIVGQIRPRATIGQGNERRDSTMNDGE